MARIVWLPSYNLGIAAIDAQHRRIAAIINQLDDVLGGEASQSRVGTLLEEIVNYTKTHFWDEEELMRRLDFDDREDHMAEHRAFVEQTRCFIRRFLDGDRGVTAELTGYLCNWFLHHITVEDVRYRDLIAPEQAKDMGDKFISPTR